MATAFDCTEPKDAWRLVSHFLGNLLLVISMKSEAEESKSEDERGRRETERGRTHAQLIGLLYLLVLRMKESGHQDTSSKVQQILDMVVAVDTNDKNALQAIHHKHEELDPDHAVFRKALEENFPGGRRR